MSKCINEDEGDHRTSSYASPDGLDVMMKFYIKTLLETSYKPKSKGSLMDYEAQ